jgi:hypothetical protein
MRPLRMKSSRVRQEKTSGSSRVNDLYAKLDAFCFAEKAVIDGLQKSVLNGSVRDVRFSFEIDR